MKTYIKTNIIGLFQILLVFALTLYFIVIIIKYPLVGIEVKEENNQWMVENIYKKVGQTTTNRRRRYFKTCQWREPRKPFYYFNI